MPYARRIHGRAVIAALLLFAPIACRDAGGPSQRNLSVSFATVTGDAAHSGPLTLSAGAHTLTISSAELVLSRIELKTSDVASCADDDTERVDDRIAADHGDEGGEMEDRCEEVELDPMAVALPLDSAVVTALAVDIPPGTYEALEARIEPARAGERGGAALVAAHPELAGASIHVTGTFDDAPFDYTGSVDARLEMRFDPPLTVTSGPTNVTVHVNIAGWFRDDAGALIDPTTANAGGPNSELVARNIERSLRAFRDDEHRGDDGRGDADGTHDGGHDGGGDG